MNIYQKLAQVRKSIPVLYKKYSDSLKAKVMSSEDLLQEINEHINNAGLFLITEQIEEPVVIRYTEDKEKWDNYAKKQISYKSTTYEASVKLKYTWINIDNPEEKLSLNWFCTAINQQGDPAKSIGAALTYSEKYFLLKFFNIETSKDDPDFKKVENSSNVPETKTEQTKKQQPKTGPVAAEKKDSEVISFPGGKFIDVELKNKIIKMIDEKKGIYKSVKEWADGMANLNKFYTDKGYTSLLDLAWFEEAFNKIKPESEA